MHNNLYNSSLKEPSSVVTQVKNLFDIEEFGVRANEQGCDVKSDESLSNEILKLISPASFGHATEKNDTTYNIITQQGNKPSLYDYEEFKYLNETCNNTSKQSMYYLRFIYSRIIDCYSREYNIDMDTARLPAIADYYFFTLTLNFKKRSLYIGLNTPRRGCLFSYTSGLFLPGYKSGVGSKEFRKKQLTYLRSLKHKEKKLVKKKQQVLR